MNSLARKALLVTLFSLLLGRETAATLEPNDHVHDDRTEMSPDAGSPGTAARYCRQGVAAYLTLDSHSDLSRPDLPPEGLETAIHGFEDVRGEVLMVPPALIEIHAARLLVAQRPCSNDARFLLGLLALNPGASVFGKQCASMAPGVAR